MKHWKNILITIGILCIPTLVCVIFASSLANWQMRSYYGSEQFDNYTEAVMFQAKIASQAEAQDGISEITITKASPPVVTYRVTLPSGDNELSLIDTTDFPYGSKAMNQFESLLLVILLSVFGYGMFGYLIYIMWADDKQDESN